MGSYILGVQNFLLANRTELVTGLSNAHYIKLRNTTRELYIGDYSNNRIFIYNLVSGVPRSISGISLSITGGSGSGSSVTLTFAAQPAAPFNIGQYIYNNGITPSGYNGSYIVTGCTTTSVTYSSATTGAITVNGKVHGINSNVNNGGDITFNTAGVCFDSAETYYYVTSDRPTITKVRASDDAIMNILDLSAFGTAPRSPRGIAIYNDTDIFLAVSNPSTLKLKINIASFSVTDSYTDSKAYALTNVSNQQLWVTNEIDTILRIYSLPDMILQYSIDVGVSSLGIDFDIFSGSVFLDSSTTAILIELDGAIIKQVAQYGLSSRILSLLYDQVTNKYYAVGAIDGILVSYDKQIK